MGQEREMLGDILSIVHYHINSWRKITDSIGTDKKLLHGVPWDYCFINNLYLLYPLLKAQTLGKGYKDNSYCLFSQYTFPVFFSNIWLINTASDLPSFCHPCLLQPFICTLTSSFQVEQCSETLPSGGHSQRAHEHWAPQTPNHPRKDTYKRSSFHKWAFGGWGN